MLDFILGLQYAVYRRTHGSDERQSVGCGAGVPDRFDKTVVEMIISLFSRSQYHQHVAQIERVSAICDSLQCVRVFRPAQQ